MREAHTVLDPRGFRDLRRENSAIRLCFGLFEYTLGIDLPDEVFEDKTFASLYWGAADMVCWANVCHVISLASELKLKRTADRTCTRTTWSKLRDTQATISSLC